MTTMINTSSNSSNNVYMVFGKTGNGKSTLIKLFCGDNAPSDIVGHSTKSKTKGSSFYEELDINKSVKRLWVDTQGTSDSTDKISDKDILRNVMRKMYEKYPKGLNIKVVWIVQPCVRSSDDFNKQSSFINSLGEYSKLSIWDSTIIIVRGGRKKPGKQSTGALSSAARYYKNTKTDKHNNILAKIDCIGYTMMSALDQDDEDELDVYEQNKECDTKYRMTNGYLYDDEIKSELNNLLNSKKFFYVSFGEDKCKKCGIVGDKRFVKTHCHPGFHKVHGEGTTHPGKIKKRHKSGESLISYHTASWTYDEVIESAETNWIPKCPKGHTGNLEERVMNYGKRMCSKCLWWMGSDYGTFHRCYDCSKSGHKYCRDCMQREANGVIYDKKRNYYWACCRSSNSSDPGCQKRWNSCGNNEYHEGCEEYFDCCDQEVRSKSCSHKCCNKKIIDEPIGCIDVCKQCNVKYGQGPGCSTENTDHQF